MAFVGRLSLPDLRLVARQLAAVLTTGALQSEALRDSAGPRDAVDTARDFLAAHLEGRPTLEATAAAAGVTKFTLLRRFRRILGTTPHAYLIMLRLTRAQRMLAEGWTPAAAAAAAGFAGRSASPRPDTPDTSRPADGQFRSRHRTSRMTL